MNLYPAIQARMGSWTYYMMRMTMREVAENVRFAADIWDDRTLDDAIQRVLDESRVKKEIVQYLTRQDHRFFSSIVIAALGGNAQWVPLEISDVPSMQLLSGYEPLQNTFGVLRFDGRQKYYALDGQHRLCAIKALIDRTSDAWRDAPQTFPDEEISVIVIVRPGGLPETEFFKRYRRLFGNLNRYARPTDNVTNIIMDEDDVFAIVTRRLITDHDFFKAAGRHHDSPRIKTTKGKNLTIGSSHFTSLETLYSLNKTLLCSRVRRNNEWSKAQLKLYIRFRPDDDYIDELYEELTTCWDALIDTLPDLRRDPPKMRCHRTDDHDEEHSDSALFWPIGQEVLAELARDLLDDGASGGIESLHDRLMPLSDLSWELHRVPWRHLVLVPVASEERPWISWKMRSEERKPSLDVAKEILWLQAGYHSLTADDLQGLRQRWEGLLLPALYREEIDDLWAAIMDGVVRQ